MTQALLLELLDKMYQNIRTKIVDKECTDEDISKALTTFHPSVNKEYFRATDYCNYDESCKILCLSHNRGRLRQLCDEYGIECVYVKNRPLGFPRKDIERLRDILNDEVKEREKKQLRKKGIRKFLW